MKGGTPTVKAVWEEFEALSYGEFTNDSETTFQIVGPTLSPT